MESDGSNESSERTTDSSKSGSGSSTALLDSEQGILDAAIAEFSEKGFNGARIEAIARRAGYNKSLVYRYFTDKTGLFEAALREKLEQRLQLAAELPSALSEALAYWFHESLSDPHYLRMLQQEAFGYSDGSVIEENLRKEYYRHLLELLERRQKEGLVSEVYDPPALLLAFTALVVFPAVFPQIVRLITDRSLCDKDFQEGWKALLAQLAEAINESGGEEVSSPEGTPVSTG